jgi:hypothetical protein
MKSIAETIDTLDWDRIGTELHERGWATTGSLLSVQETASLAASYDDDEQVAGGSSSRCHRHVRHPTDIRGGSSLSRRPAGIAGQLWALNGTSALCGSAEVPRPA